MPALGRIRPVNGAPCWVSLMARDLHAAQAFYTDVMGWEFIASTLGSNFCVAMAHGRPVAGIGCCSSAATSPPAVWTPYFAVDDADETADRVRERGATLAVGPVKLGEGRAAMAADRDGAVFGFWEGTALAWSVGQGSAPARLDLQTRHAFEAAIFYAEVFGWAEPPGGCTVDYAQEHVRVTLEGRTVATLRGGGIETAADPRIRPRWNVDFRVEDSARAAATAIDAGGESSLVPARDGPSKDSFIIRDPDGALFTVSGP
ncbi:VOC family protein [Streptomyces sp. NBC_01363]|uniref:VOC family protein n=1 Tax=Streptomyces sp. NBC_01363 TaxID=2903840 RepID=UPI00224EDD20|nr:VOC family protein [Streptomyces sp. NBC_01363]MCX4734265.1 VOC family protein [Streptomyces sp. NBC_01363]